MLIDSFGIFKNIKSFFTNILLGTPETYKRFENIKIIFAGTLLKTIKVSKRGFEDIKGSFKTLFILIKKL